MEGLETTHRVIVEYLRKPRSAQANDDNLENPEKLCKSDWMGQIDRNGHSVVPEPMAFAGHNVSPRDSVGYNLRFVLVGKFSRYEW